MRLHLPIFLLGLVVLILGGASKAPVVRAAPLLTPQIFLPQLQSAGSSLQTDLQRQSAEEVVRLVNVERARAGCADLAIDQNLTAAAQAHSADMAEGNFFSHTSLDGSDFVDRLRAAGYTGSPGGENIAAGYSTAAAVMDGWMKSSGHRANILNCDFRTIGVGFASSPGSTYGNYWTQDFGR